MSEAISDTDRKLLSRSQLKDLAKNLALSQKLSRVKKSEILLNRLKENEKTLFNVFKTVSQAASSDQSISPAAEWLLDNFYLIEENIRLATKHFPKSYCKELPSFTEGLYSGSPRIYGIVLELIYHVDGILDEESLDVFIKSYQEIKALNLGELWAIPIMLRLALIENIRRVSEQISLACVEQNLAAQWANRIIDSAKTNPETSIHVLADLSKSKANMPSSFVAELSKRLHADYDTTSFSINWFERNLIEHGISIGHYIDLEKQRQAANQVSISNSIGSLRFLSLIDWREFVEIHSVVNDLLLKDPAGVYSRMDFRTRDRYRHIIEKTAKKNKISELLVTKIALDISKSDSDITSPKHPKHVGHFLIGDEYDVLLKAIHKKTSILFKIRNLFNKSISAGYPFLILFATFVATLAMLNAGEIWKLSIFQKTVLALSFFVSLSQPIVSCINWLITKTLRPKPLPKLDFKNGIPSNKKAIVVIPTMLSSKEAVDDLIHHLEIQYIANTDQNLRFAILTDFPDSPHEILPNDDLLLRLASEGINRLNHRYADETGNGDYFFLFHRSRSWNKSESAWMGFERKRGKLHDLNLFLRDNKQKLFSTVVGNIERLKDIKYVITLDTDTKLPRGAARELVGCISHPLNKPVIDPKTRRVISGYAILQPRVGITMESTNRSWFVRIFAEEPGVDPYTKEVSDVYQDLFGEGSYIGKGIYDIDALEISLAGRFPDNRILSHDLIESCFARSAIASDILLYEEHPTKYNSDSARRHRWIRGDWQILSWMLPLAPTANSNFSRNSISSLGRWKIFDNLRRSLVATAFLIALIAVYFVWEIPDIVLMILIFLPFTSTTLSGLGILFSKSTDIPLRNHLRETSKTSLRSFVQNALNLCFLPYEAYLNLDAIFRSLFRMYISKKRLLEWKSASSTEINSEINIVNFYSSMMACPLMGILIFLTIHNSQFGFKSLVFLGLAISWLVSPSIAWWISLPLKDKESKISEVDAQFLRILSRKIWAFFEDFVTEENNWLPIDNFQEYPKPKHAPRTSPTNIGLYLLSALGSYDFGYISAGELLDRSEMTLNSMIRLKRFRGHLFNWYDTNSMEVLNPPYISTVDSGNLIGCLWALKNGVANLKDDLILPTQHFEGLRCSVNMVQEFANQNSKENKDFYFQRTNKIENLVKTLSKIDLNSENLFEIYVVLMEFGTQLEELKKLLSQTQRVGDDVTWAMNKLQGQYQSMLKWISEVTPWLSDIYQFREIFQTNEQLKSAFECLTKNQKLNNYERADFWEATNNILGNTIRPIATITDDQANGLISAIQNSLNNHRIKIAKFNNQILIIDQIISGLMDVDYDFLYNQKNKLFSIGYNVEKKRKDESYYDLLASEARLTSFVAIAHGAVPTEHWFALGRLLTRMHGRPLLLSWSGSAFEYLMPLLILPTYPHTLLHESLKTVIQRQKAYARQNQIPWGVSESGYNATDADLNFQYRAFGVPGLGFKRGLADDLVVAPYASIMSLMIDGVSATKNLRKMEEAGFVGRYGFYEAIDYSKNRVPVGKRFAIVQSFMAHHQGMSFLSLLYLLKDTPIQKRMKKDPWFEAAESLLQEKVPNTAPFFPHSSDVSKFRWHSKQRQSYLRIYQTAHTYCPEVQLLSNGTLHSILTNSGAGSLKWQDIQITRRRDDPLLEEYGSFLYIRDLDKDKTWSATFAPIKFKPDKYEVIFTENQAETKLKMHDIEIHQQIAISPEDNVEIRRFRVANHDEEPRRLELTFYSELSMQPQASDLAHPAFHKLFVETKSDLSRKMLIATRRQRSSNEATLMSFQKLNTYGNSEFYDFSCETDRVSFIGRRRGIVNPVCLDHNFSKLSGRTGAVLDPIFALRINLLIPAEHSLSFDLITGVSDNQTTLDNLVEEYSEQRFVSRAFDLSWTHGQLLLQQLSITEAKGQLFSRLAGPLIFSDRRFRAPSDIIATNSKDHTNLWRYGISGDLAIILFKIKEESQFEFLHDFIQSHTYLSYKGLFFDLVIWNEEDTGYRNELGDQIRDLVNTTSRPAGREGKGQIFTLNVENIAHEDKLLIQACSNIIVDDSVKGLSELFKKTGILHQEFEKFKKNVTLPVPLLKSRSTKNDKANQLLFFNGYGGFSKSENEYVIITNQKNIPPAPWVNVIANPLLGTLVSEGGGSYTWRENAHEYRLTPWNNDAVCDLKGEAFYIKDIDSGECWSPTPLPTPTPGDYEIRHGFGYSQFLHKYHDIYSALEIFLPAIEPVKISILKLHNYSKKIRNIQITGYVDWVLAEHPTNSIHILTDEDNESGAILATNSFNPEFKNEIAFFYITGSSRTFTCDKREFLGRHGSIANPAGTSEKGLNHRKGSGMESCCALQTSITLNPDESREMVFILGSANSKAEVRALIDRFKEKDTASSNLKLANRAWRKIFNKIQIDTPDHTLNILANGWLPYQILSSRIFGRSGYYQSAGAYGFRDQLQDAHALATMSPAILREQIIRCAGRQFKEGDVQHWWHPPLKKGVRTHFSDDYLWLPWSVIHYLKRTGDFSILDIEIPFIEGPLLPSEQEAIYDQFNTSTESVDVYNHCVRAISKSFKFGMHGFPLIGCGDWNDGMNLVGAKGKGESVWLAFFLFDILTQFASIAKRKGDPEFALKCNENAETLKANIEKNGWDGDWYLRAFFDDGTPLGSHQSDECQIDSLPQSWAVLSGAADVERTKIALANVERRLVKRERGLIKLLDPPFDKSPLNPGYIKGYVPGVRENGGQYTHAAVWLAMAFARVGDYNRAYELAMLINLILHGDTAAAIETYKVEPYVIAADIYSVKPNEGRGGWTWYTGAAGWYYKLIVESILGIEVYGNRLQIDPRIPDHWNSFKAIVYYGNTPYKIIVSRLESGEEPKLYRDDQLVENTFVELIDDKVEHTIRFEWPHGLNETWMKRCQNIDRFNEIQKN